MSPEQQLIEQIRQVLATNQLDNRAQLLESSDLFADACRQANERLLRCADYLGKGRRSEAVYEAHLSPDLLKLGDALSGDWLKKWQNVVLDLELTPFQPLNEGVLDQLRQACASEESLEPLLKEYRRSVYQSDHVRCIQLLRQIRERDSGNGVWEKNLRPLEEAFLPQWIERAERGLASMDLADLKVVFAELTHPQRAVQPPEELMKRLRRALLSERSVDLETEGELLLAKIKHAVEHGQADELSALWSSAEALERDEAFLHRPEGWEQVLASSHAFAEKHARQQSEREAFDRAVSQLKDMLMDGKTSAIELRHAYERLETWGFPIPDLLVRQVDDLLSLRRRSQRRRVLLVCTSMVAVIVMVAVSGAWFAYRHRVAENRTEWLARAESYSQAGKLDELEVLLEEIRQSDFSYFDSSELAGIRQKLSEARALQDRNRRSYELYKTTLEAIRNGNYRGDKAVITRAIEDAKAVAVSSSEKDYVIRWQNEWLRFTAEQERDVDADIFPKLTAIQTALDGIHKAENEGIGDEIKTLERLAKDFQALDEQRIALGSDELSKRHGVVKGLLTARLSDARRRQSAFASREQATREERQRVAETLKKLRRSLPGALPNFDSYERLLKEMVSLGRTMPEITDYAVVLDNLRHYRQVVALGAGIPADTLTGRLVLGEVEAMLKRGIPGATSIWYSDMERVQRLGQANRNLQRAASGLISLRKGDMYVFKHRRRGEKDWRYFYGERPFQSQQKDGCIHYWGSALWATDDESKASSTPISTIYGGMMITSLDFEVVLSRIKSDNLAPHVQRLKKLVMESIRSDDVPVYVLGELEKLRHAEDVDPIQGFLIFKRFINLLSEHCLEDLPEAGVWASRANRIDTEVPWQRADHPRTIAVRQAVQSFWKDIPDLTLLRRRLELNRALLQAVLRLNLRCVGSVQTDAAGKKVYLPVAPAREFWLYRPADSGVLSSFQLLSVDGTGNPSSAELSRCRVGTPLFGPLEGHELRPFYKRVCAGAEGQLKEVRFPRAFPENLR